MAEVETTDLPIASSQASVLADQALAPKTDTETPVIESQIRIDKTEQQQNIPASSGEAEEQHDEVQFVFSAPRRRKKKRKR
jgi:hypothetical protein